MQDFRADRGGGALHQDGWAYLFRRQLLSKLFAKESARHQRFIDPTQLIESQCPQAAAKRITDDESASQCRRADNNPK